MHCIILSFGLINTEKDYIIERLHLTVQQYYFFFFLLYMNISHPDTTLGQKLRAEVVRTPSPPQARTLLEFDLTSNQCHNNCNMKLCISCI